MRLRANGLTIQGRDENVERRIRAAAEAFWNITARDIGDAKVTVTA